MTNELLHQLHIAVGDAFPQTIAAIQRGSYEESLKAFSREFGHVHADATLYRTRILLNENSDETLFWQACACRNAIAVLGGLSSFTRDVAHCLAQLAA